MPAYTATLSGTTATFAGNSSGGSGDIIVFSQSGGLLMHNRGLIDAGFSSAFDFNSKVAGDQTLAVSNTSIINLTTGNGPDEIDIGGSVASNFQSFGASTLFAHFNLSHTNSSNAVIFITDRASNSGNSFTFASDSVTANGINVSISGSAFSGGIFLDTGSGNDTVNLTSVLAIGNGVEPRLVNNFDGNDTVTIGSAGGSLDGFAGQTISVSGIAGTTAVKLNDSSDINSNTYNINSTDIRREGGANDVVVIADGTGVGISLISGNGDDTFNIAPRSMQTINIDGGGGTNSLAIDLTGTTNPVHIPTSATSGTTTYDNKSDVNYQNIQNFSGINGTFGSNNPPPTNLNINTVATILENVQITLDGTFTNPDGEAHTVTIDFGDGSAKSTINLAAGATTFNTSHTYLDDATSGTSSDQFTINATVSDGVGSASDSTIITVNNVVPSNAVVTATPVNVGNSSQITVTFTDPGTLDPHLIDFDFGDGTKKSVGFAPGNTTATFNHVYSTTGTFIITAVVNDDDLGSSPISQTTVLVSPPNTNPTISNVGNQSGFGNIGPVDVTIGDAETPANFLTLTGVSSNAALFPAGSIFTNGTGKNRTVLLVPASGQTGTATITLTVTDGGGQTATDTFNVTVSPPPPPPNILPSISDVQNVSAPFGGFSAVTPFFVSDTETAAGNLTVTATSNNLALVANSGIVLGGGGTNRSFFIAPNAGQTGTATITFTVTDSNGGTATDSFDVTVNPPPALPTPPAGVTVQEAAGANAASIQSAVDAFRALIGGGSTPGAAGSFGGIRREINWDGVPAAKENPFPGDFFNTTSPRGVLLSSNGSGLAVSGAAGTAGFEFGNLNSTATDEFSSFSSPKLFTALGTTTYDVEFRVAGTNIPAGVRSFGVVFSDVDLANVSKLEFFAADGTLLLTRDVLPSGVTHEGLSFLGVQLPVGTLAAKVRVTSGNVPLDSTATTPPGDIVVVDDFIFSEPAALPPVVKTDIFAVGTGAGVETQVNVFNANGTLRFALKPFPNFFGGANVSTGDVTGDGFEDIAVGAGPGGGPHVKVFDGKTGEEIQSFFAYSTDFTGGVFVGLGDTNGDLRADVVTGTGVGGGPHVKVFDGVTNTVLKNFFAYDSSFRGGVTVRAGDVSGDGFADIVTGAGPGGGPHVKVFDAKTLAELQSFFAGNPDSRGGVFVGVADFTGSGTALVTVSSNGAVFAPGYIEQDNLIRPLGSKTADRIPVAAIRLSSGRVALLVGSVPGADGKVRIIDGTSNTIVQELLPFGDNFTGGIFVG